MLASEESRSGSCPHLAADLCKVPEGQPSSSSEALKQAAGAGRKLDNSGVLVKDVQPGRLLHRQDVALNSKIFFPWDNTLL